MMCWGNPSFLKFLLLSFSGKDYPFRSQEHHVEEKAEASHAELSGASWKSRLSCKKLQNLLKSASSALLFLLFHGESFGKGRSLDEHWGRGSGLGQLQMHAVICRGHMFLEISSPLNSWFYGGRGEGIPWYKKKAKEKVLPVKRALAKHLLSAQRAPGPW